MILEQLKADKIKAMKMHDEAAKSALTSVLGAVTNAAIAQGCKDNITDELVNAVLLKEKKTMQEMIDTCPKDREDLSRGYKSKMMIIDEFAPVLMTSEKEIQDFVNSLDIELTKANRGVIMKALKGKADMKIANQVVSSILK